MRWELSEEQELFRESLSGWLDRFAPTESVRKWLHSGDFSEFDDKFADEGWACVGLPETIGGQGGGLLELTLAAEELGRHSAPSSTWLATALIAPLLPAELAERVLSGQVSAVLAADASRAPDVPGNFQVSGDGTVSGSASAVLGADSAATLVVPAQGPDGLGLYRVDSCVAGVSVRPRKMLDRSRSTADVRLADAPATRLDVAADVALADVALRAAVLTAADALGAMEQMLGLAVSYTKTRQQFGVPIGSFQAVKHTAATMLVAVEAGRSIAYFAAQSVDEQHPERAAHAAVAKAQVTASAVAAADSALTLHGAVGYTWEHDLHLSYKRAKLDAQLYGSPTAWNERLADLLPLVPAAS